MASLINTKAPAFTAPAVMPDGSTKDLSLSDYAGKYVALVFYPKDFTFVCPSELIALDHKVAELEHRNCVVLGVSMDDAETHAKWRQTAIDDGGIGSLAYPLIADDAKRISEAYDVVHADSGLSYRATFLIDREGTVQSAVHNNLPLGRNMEELIRMVDALQFHEEHGEVCPANWQPGKAAMAPTAEGVAAYLKEHASSL
ncbi:MAG: peroxiredoxin [Planctomycetota bacterium]|nr:peroxiredoxin [Planctomycetota bacterium]MEC8511084.1 peroxiredoxin [Planctomycetota bacterium]